MKEQDVKETLNDIRDIMSQSSRFQAISGWSIVMVGILAAVASYLVAGVLGFINFPFDIQFVEDYSSLNAQYKLKTSSLIALVLLIVCLATVFVMAYVKSKRHNLRFAFDKRTLMMCVDFAIPMIAGGLLSFALILQHHYGLTSSVMMIFYGFALVNCSHYTYSTLRYLGYAELVLGLIDCFIVNHALFFWFLGFSILHIVFGIIYIIKFERK